MNNKKDIETLKYMRNRLAGKSSYEVGYGKPPKSSQFKKGCSGNPTGRKKKVIPKSIKESLELELTKQLTITNELDKKENNSNKTFVVLMLNPSNTFPEMNGKKSTVDGTVKNAVRIAYKAGYSKVIILNSFNYIDGNSLTAIKSASQTSNDINAKIISNVLAEHKDLMIAWGTKVRQKDKNMILSSIWDKVTDLKIYAYAWNKNSNCPYHPATRVDNKKNNYPLTKFLTGKTNLLELAVIKQKDKFDLQFNN